MSPDALAGMIEASAKAMQRDIDREVLWSML